MSFSTLVILRISIQELWSLTSLNPYRLVFILIRIKEHKTMLKSLLMPSKLVLLYSYWTKRQVEYGDRNSALESAPHFFRGTRPGTTSRMCDTSAKADSDVERLPCSAPSKVYFTRTRRQTVRCKLAHAIEPTDRADKILHVTD